MSVTFYSVLMTEKGLLTARLPSHVMRRDTTTEMAEWTTVTTESIKSIQVTSSERFLPPKTQSINQSINCRFFYDDGGAAGRGVSN